MLVRRKFDRIIDLCYILAVIMARKKSTTKWVFALAGIWAVFKTAAFFKQKKNRKNMKNIIQQAQDVTQKKWHELAKDYFIPHSDNGHRPKILRPRSIQILTIGLLLTKIALVSVLFALYPTGAFLSGALEDAMVKLTNDYRLTVKAPPLVRNEYLDSIAFVRAQDMLDRGYFSHYTPDGKAPWQWIDQSQYGYMRFGENLAIDFITAEAVMKAFQASPSHDKNLKNDYYHDIGVAVVSGQMQGRETNLMVIFFGATKTPTPPLAVSPTTVKPAVPTPVPTTTVPIVTSQPTSTQDIQPIQPPIQVVTVTPPDTSTSTDHTSLVINTEPNTTTVAGLEEPVIDPIVDDKVTVIAQPENALQRLIHWSDNFYLMILLAFVVIALLNIFIAIKVQHRSTIVASLFIILLAGFLWWSNWHVYEGFSGIVTILGLSI